jgi:hypothetical protein
MRFFFTKLREGIMRFWNWVGIAGLVSVSIVHADPNDAKYSEIYVGPQGYYAKAKIRGLSPNFHGSLWGGVFGYQYMKPYSLYFRLQGDWAIGRIKSKGNPSRYLHDENVEGDFGYTWCPGKWRVIPYVGYAFHYLIENREETEEFTGTKFKYQTYNIPVGMRVDYLFNRHFELGVKAQWMYNIDPAVKISQLQGALWTLVHKQGVRVDLPFQYNFGKAIQGVLRLSPFFQWYQLGRTKAVTDDGVPLGVTTQTFTYWGGLLTLGWKF